MTTSSSLSFPRQPAWQNGYLAFFLFLAAAMALYAGSLHNPTLFDDYFYNVIHDRPGSWNFRSPRALDDASIVGVSQLFGTGLPPQRILNVCLHALDSALVFVFAKNLLLWLLRVRDDQSELATNVFYASLMAATLFLLHPVTVYDVAYLNQRSTAMATAFTLMMLLSFWEYLRRSSVPYALASLVFYVLALTSKEHSIMAPALCMSLTVLHDGGIRRERLKLLLPFALVCAVLAYVVVIRNLGAQVLGQNPEYTSGKLLDNYARLHPGFTKGRMMVYSVQTQATLFFNYWRFWLLPDPREMSVDIRAAFATTGLSWYTLGTVIYALYGLIAATLLFSRDSLRRFYGFSLLAPWLMFWTEFTSLRLQEIFVLYRTYIWFIFLMPAVALLLYRTRGRVCIGIWAAICLVYILCASNRIDTFYSETSLWRDAAILADDIHEVRPGIERIYYNLGTSELKTDLPQVYPDALLNLQRALAYVPNSELKPQMMFNLALTYKRMERYKEAIAVYEPLVHQVDPDNDQAWWLMGSSMEAIGDDVNARDAYETACDMHNRYACDRLKEEPELGLNGAPVENVGSADEDSDSGQ